ncbi:hypothetical protein [uncultured Nostoc sp.]
MKDYWEPGGFLVVRCGKRVQKVFSGENVAIFVGIGGEKDVQSFTIK